MEVKDIMTRREAADYMNISLSKFNMIQPELKQIRLCGSVRFRKSDIDEYLDAHVVRGTK